MYTLVIIDVEFTRPFARADFAVYDVTWRVSSSYISNFYDYKEERIVFPQF